MSKDPEAHKQEEEALPEEALNEETSSLEETELELQNELEDYKNKYLRVLAELENTRKRMQKEKHETVRFGIENAIGEFLPVIDNFENALKFADNSSEELKNWASGFQMILSQFKDVLHNHGIVAFHSEGNLFDPHHHEAVEIIHNDEHPDGTILQEFSKGYKSATRTIRPARVKVSKKIPAEESPTESESEELQK